MMTKQDNRYGFGQNPPYSLYQAPDGRWGLIDGDGNKLEAVFKKGESNLYSRTPEEVVSFDEQEGFELVAWYDPCEVWFNFTWEDPGYPDEFAKLLWKKPEHDIHFYRDTIYKLMPEEHHWLLDEIYDARNLNEREDDDFYLAIDAMVYTYPELSDAALSNPLLDPVMRNEDVDEDVKIALWREKVYLDSRIKIYKEDYPDGI